MTPERIAELRAIIAAATTWHNATFLIAARKDFPQALDTIEAQAAHIATLEAVIGLALEYWAHRQQRYRNRAPIWVTAARAALQPKEPS